LQLFDAATRKLGEINFLNAISNFVGRAPLLSVPHVEVFTARTLSLYNLMERIFWPKIMQKNTNTHGFKKLRDALNGITENP